MNKLTTLLMCGCILGLTNRMLACSGSPPLTREARAVVAVKSIEMLCNEFAPGAYPASLPELKVVCEALKFANTPKLEPATAGAPG